MQESARAWRLPVLMYHSVPAAADLADRRAVARDRLAEQLGSLRARGWELLGLTEALSVLGRDPCRRVIALTFDDGLVDFLNAFEVLVRLEVGATLYVPTALVGRNTSAGVATLGWSELAQLAGAGIEIGSHSCWHRPLDVLDAPTVITEVAWSKNTLQERLGAEVVSFCYPHGYTSARVIRAVAEAGYANACVIGRRVCTSDDGRCTIPRLEVRPTVTGADIHSLVDVGEPGLVPVAKRLATPAWRAVRRASSALLHRELT
jgi:peptidoglycan/xylan/chitin deacetylase (PgdA/CDA1 family)